MTCQNRAQSATEGISILHCALVFLFCDSRWVGAWPITIFYRLTIVSLYRHIYTKYIQITYRGSLDFGIPGRPGIMYECGAIGT